MKKTHPISELYAFSNIADFGIIVHDVDSNILAVTMPICLMAGYSSPEELEGQKMRALIPPDINTPHDEDMSKYLKRESMDTLSNVPMRQKSGLSLMVDVQRKAYFVRGEGRFAGIVYPHGTVIKDDEGGGSIRLPKEPLIRKFKKVEPEKKKLVTTLKENGLLVEHAKAENSLFVSFLERLAGRRERQHQDYSRDRTED